MMRRVLATAVLSTVVAVVAPATGAGAVAARPVNPPMIAAPCRFEDGSGSGRVCFWDGRHQGNGRGSSYLVTHDTRGRAHFHPLTHAEAHALLKAWRGSRCVR